jgi:hypothetical protein
VWRCPPCCVSTCRGWHARRHHRRDGRVLMGPCCVLVPFVVQHEPRPPFLVKRRYGWLSLRLTSSRCGALSLLHHGALKKPAKLVVDLLPLHSGWLWHHLEEYFHRSDILASPFKEWGLITPSSLLMQ